MDQLLTLLEHGGVIAVLAYMYYQERKERLVQMELILKLLQKCLNDQAELVDEEFGPNHK